MRNREAESGSRREIGSRRASAEHLIVGCGIVFRLRPDCRSRTLRGQANPVARYAVSMLFSKEFLPAAPVAQLDRASGYEPAQNY